MEPCLQDPSEILQILEDSVQDWIIQKASIHDVVRTLVENCRQLNLEFHGQTPADGNCFFHAVCDQMELLGFPAMTVGDLRRDVVTYMKSNPIIEGDDGPVDLTQVYPDWSSYCEKMEKEGEWADHVVILATANFLKRDIMIVTSSPESGQSISCRIRCGVDDYKENPLWLGHIWEWHYQSLKPISSKKPIKVETEENFIKLNLALQVICSASIPCLNDILTSWHEDTRKKNIACMTSQQCINKGRPKPKPKSCSECRAWRNAIESSYYPASNVDRIPWLNINPTRLHHDMLEVAKAYTFRLPPGKSYTSLGDFDAGSLLAIMYHFKEYHQEDPTVYSSIRKVEDIRNSLSHTNVSDKLNFNQKLADGYFTDLKTFITSIEKLHPTHFTQSVVQELVDQLNRLHKLPLECNNCNPVIIQSIHNLHGEVTANKHETASLRLHLEELMGKPETPVPDELDLAQCRKELRYHYLHSRCKIPLIPGDKTNCINMDDIYTELSILLHLPSLNRPLVVPLKSHHEIFTRLAKDDFLSYRVLVLGKPGSGKTILTCKLAYDWAIENPESPLRDMSLLFVLSMRWMSSETTLEDAIFQQLLPKDTKIGKASLRNHIQMNQTSCVIILDSYDEYGFSGHLTSTESTLAGVLLNENLRECRVLVTSRFWKASDFDNLRDVYTEIEISGFSNVSVEKYVRKFFADDKESAEKMVNFMEQNGLNPGLANIPLMTLLLCLCWKGYGEDHMPRKIGDLYDAIVKFLYKRYKTKETSETLNIEQLVIETGRVALSGLWSTEETQDRIVFTLSEFVDKSSRETVIAGCKIGLLSIEQQPTNPIMSFLTDDDGGDPLCENLTEDYLTNPKTSITYFHKSCQEKCAGEYLAHISQTDYPNFASRMKLLNTAKTCKRLELVLRFACGASRLAATSILKQLLFVFEVEYASSIHAFYHEMLSPDQTKNIQDFIELCLLCYYEGPQHFQVCLQPLFPYRQISFFGMSPYTSSAIGKYMLTDSIDCLTIEEIPNSDQMHLPSENDGVLGKAYSMIRHQLQRLPDETLQKMFEHEMITDKKYQFRELSRTEYCKYFKNWQSESIANLSQMFEAKTEVPLNLKILCLINVRLGSQMEHLQNFIKNGYLLELTDLCLFNVGISELLANELLLSIQDQLPNLKCLNISCNGPIRMHRLGERIVNTQINELAAERNGASVEDMTNLVTQFSEFGSRMTTLLISDNAIDDKSGRKLANAMPTLYCLKKLSFTVYRMKKSTQKKIIKGLCHLPLLTYLIITAIWYLDDLIKYMSKVMPYLPELETVTFESSAIVTQETIFTDPLPKWVVGKQNQTKEIQRSVGKSFVAGLDSLKKLRHLTLIEFPFDKENVMSLLFLCGRHDGCRLRLSRRYLPKDVNPVDYDFLDLYWKDTISIGV